MNEEIQIRLSRPEDSEEHLDLIALAFSAMDETSVINDETLSGKRRYFKEMMANDPWFKNAPLYLAICAGRIASCLHVFLRDINYHEKKVCFGGIGVVATHPDYRGRHLASLLIDQAGAGMTERQCVASVIKGGANLYERAGWMVFPGGNLTIDLQNMPDIRENKAGHFLNASEVAARINMLANQPHWSGTAGVHDAVEWKNLSAWLTTLPGRVLSLNLNNIEVLVRVTGAPPHCFLVQDIVPARQELIIPIWEALANFAATSGYTFLRSSVLGNDNPCLKELQEIKAFQNRCSFHENRGFRVKIHEPDTLAAITGVDVKGVSDQRQLAAILFPGAYWQQDHL